MPRGCTRWKRCAMSEPLLVARDLRKRYTIGRRDVEVLRGVSLNIEAGEFVALRGASGAGKSTLLHLIGGLDSPDSGDIVVSGQNLARISGSALSRFRTEKIGFIF